MSISESTLPMSEVHLDITSENYITSETAKLTFTATLALTDPKVDPRTEILGAAAKLIPDAEWYVTGNSRREDTSGIETVTYQLTVRVKEKVLNSIKAGIKGVNRSGLRFEIIATDYTPTQAQIEAGTIELRGDIYKKALAEVKLLNDSLGDMDEKWFVGGITFNARPQMSKNLRAAGSQMYANAALSFNESAGGEEEDDGITQKLSITANAVFARKVYTRI